jgi:tripartite-type tricarboxylate transporter receptor subunit TctC
MSLPRYPFLAMLVPVVLASVAHAQTPPAFPVKPVRLVVPFPAGGPTDAAARLLQPKLIESLGQPVVIDNRSGASTIIGTEAVAKSPADGHVWLMTTSSIAINPAVHTKLPYDTVRDLAPVTLVLSNPFLLVTHPALPVKSAADLIRLAKSKPGQLMYPSSGVGSSNHLAGVQFSMMAGIDTLHIPYKGSAPAIADLIAGQVQFQFANPLSSVPLAKIGKLRILGAGSDKRLPMLPEVPTLSESGTPGLRLNVWFGLFTTAGTPRETINRIRAEMQKALNVPEVRERLAADGGELGGMPPEEFNTFFRNEMNVLGKVAKAAGLKPE